MITTRKRPITRPRAFTLIELLVVVAIIALLISILLPSLGNARRQAKTVVCASKLRQISLSVVIYSSEWQNSIVGNAYTSGTTVFPGLGAGITTASALSDANCPNIITCNDFMSPLADYMKINYDHGASNASRMARFNQFVNNGNFLCTENTILAAPYPPNNPGYHRMPSFDTALGFQYTNLAAGAPGYAFGIPNTWINQGSFVKPRIDQIGNPSKKIFAADGGRWWSSGSLAAVDTNLTIGSSGSPGGAFSDYGPWSANSRAYLYAATGLDGRSLSMRHGTVKAGQAMAAYKMNAGFFDGHVDTLDGVQAMDPNLWAPSNSSIPASEANAIAKARYWPVDPLVIR